MQVGMAVALFDIAFHVAREFLASAPRKQLTS
jgi:hypothetical protein